MPPTSSWISTPSPQNLQEQYVRFRRVFSLKAQPSSSIIYISADSRYRLYINGEYIAFGPSRCYPHHQCVDKHDITNALHAGDNLVAVLVYQPGYSHYSYVHREKLGLWVELEADRRQVLASDSTWVTSVDPSFSPQVKRISIYGAGQEIQDLRRSESWTNPDYDDRSWDAASFASKLEEQPWTRMQIAPLRNLLENTKRPTGGVLKYGAYIPHSDPHQEMRTAFHSKSSNTLDVPEQIGASLPSVQKDRVLLLCYDLGHSQAGSARLHFQGAKGSEKVLVSYLEKMVDGQLVLSDPSDDCQMRMTDCVKLAPGNNTYEPFTPRGGRFLLLGVVGSNHDNLSLDVEFRSRQYPLSLVRDVLPKDDTLRRIAEMCWLTLQSCALDGMVDCPWREQAVWVGDSAITAGIIAEMCDDPLPLRRMLQLAAQGVTSDGLIPGVVVNESESNVVLACSFAWVEGLAKYFALTGDRDFIEQAWTVLAAMLRRFQADLKADGLIHPQPLRRQFLDWADLPERDPSCVYNLRYLYALQSASLLATHIDRPEDAQTWKQWADLLAAAIRQTFCNQDQWFDDVQRNSQSQHVAAFLTLTNIVGHEEANHLMQEAVARSLDEPDNALVLMSPYMHYYLFLALEQMERGEEILEIIKHRWSIWLDLGARTTWENWEVDFPDGSQCHAWSAHPLRFISKYAKHEGNVQPQVRIDQPLPQNGEVPAIAKSIAFENEYR